MIFTYHSLAYIKTNILKADNESVKHFAMALGQEKKNSKTYEYDAHRNGLGKTRNSNNNTTHFSLLTALSLSKSQLC